jgi:hypothetical protein
MRANKNGALAGQLEIKSRFHLIDYPASSEGKH